MRLSLWSSTLSDFRVELATTAPAPAGVSIAAVSAAFALSLVVKTLEITAKASPRADALIEQAHALSGQLAKLADRDAAAFDEYLRCVRLPKDSSFRSAELAKALHETIETPLEAAQRAVQGLKLCSDAVVNPFVAPDLGAAAALLAGSVRAILVSVDFNLGTLQQGDPFLEAASAERERIGAEVEQIAAAVWPRGR
jgi:formiminotetrahydrofolate cyclodeaminase